MKPALFLILLFLIFVESLFLLFFVYKPVLAKDNSVNIKVTIAEHLSYSIVNDTEGSKLDVFTNSENGYLVMSLDGNVKDHSSGPSQKSYRLSSTDIIIIANY